MTSSERSIVLGIDVGGTFTDFVVADDASGSYAIEKVPSTPHDPSVGVLEGLRVIAERRGVDMTGLLEQVEMIVHGTTVTTNAALTGTGAKTAVLTTEGFRDMLAIGLGIRARQHIYDNKYVPPPPLVPRELRFTVRGRVTKDGEVIAALDEDGVRSAGAAMVAAGVEAVAVAFMHSYANPAHERRAGEILRAEFPALDVSLSTDVASQVRLYPRLSTTVLNAYTRPVLGRYLTTLERALRDNGFDGVLLITQSNGGVASVAEAEALPAATLLSGPAAGPTAGALYVSRQNANHCVVVDMGGTSFDAAVVWEGSPTVSPEGEVGGHLVSLPLVDIHTIGAGGGSIGWVDDGGILHMGPASAGAVPGPACYGKGGEAPTCTDANLVLGYLNPDYFLGGRMRLDVERAETAIRTHVADPLGLSVPEAALGMIELINLNMAAGIGEVTMQRGHDPREFPLVVAGGAGALHGAAIAQELGMPSVIVPRQGAVLCATGMLAMDLKHDYRTSAPRSLDEVEDEWFRSTVTELMERGYRTLTAEGLSRADVSFDVALGMRYVGQHHELTVSIPTAVVEDPGTSVRELLARRFDERHAENYGFNWSGAPAQLMVIGVTARGHRPKPDLRSSDVDGATTVEPIGSRSVYLGGEQGEIPVGVYDAHGMAPGARVEGPAIFESAATTVFVPPAFDAISDDLGSLILTHARPSRGVERNVEAASHG